MARRRYLSTAISVDRNVNKLAVVSDFAALLYTWMIPHADDDASLTGDLDEILMVVLPGRRDKTVEDIETALRHMIDLGLVSWEPGERVRFPESFYSHQSYISAARRDKAAKAAGNAGAAKTAQNSAEQRETPQNSALSSSSSSSSSLENNVPSDEERIFQHWRAAMKKNGATVFDEKRKKAVRWALKNYTLEDCLAAVEGYVRSDFHMGRDPATGGKVHNDLTLIFRDADHAEKFMAKPKTACEEIDEYWGGGCDE